MLIEFLQTRNQRKKVMAIKNEFSIIVSADMAAWRLRVTLHDREPRKETIMEIAYLPS